MSTVLTTISATTAARLTGITTANGYEIDVARVQRVKQWEEAEPSDLSIIMRAGAPELDENGPQGHEQFTIDFELMLVRRLSEDALTTDDILEDRVDEFRAAVHKRLMQDVQHSWLTANIVMADLVDGGDEAPWEGVTVTPMTFRVVYRHPRGNPYGA